MSGTCTGKAGAAEPKTCISRNVCGQSFLSEERVQKTLAWPTSAGALDIEPTMYLHRKHLQLFTEDHQG